MWAKVGFRVQHASLRRTVTPLSALFVFSIVATCYSVRSLLLVSAMQRSVSKSMVAAGAYAPTTGLIISVARWEN